MLSGYTWVSAVEGGEWPFAQEKVFGAAPVRSDGVRSVAWQTSQVGITHCTSENTKGMEANLQAYKRP